MPVRSRRASIISRRELAKIECMRKRPCCMPANALVRVEVQFVAAFAFRTRKLSPFRLISIAPACCGVARTTRWPGASTDTTRIGLPPVPVGVLSAADRCRRHAADLGVLQQRTAAHSKRRLGASGDARLFRGRGHHFRRQHAADVRRHSSSRWSRARCRGICPPAAPPRRRGPSPVR
jgi:hypothetical protein